MKTISITIVVNNGEKAARRLEKVAYGHKYGRRWIAGKLDDEDCLASDMVEEAINLLYACRGDEVTIELPATLSSVSAWIKRYCAERPRRRIRLF